MTPQEKIDKALTHLKLVRMGVRGVARMHRHNRYARPTVLLLDKIDKHLALIQTILEEE